VVRLITCIGIVMPEQLAIGRPEDLVALHERTEARPRSGRIDRSVTETIAQTR